MQPVRQRDAKPSLLEIFAGRGVAYPAARGQIDTRVRTVKKLASYRVRGRVTRLTCALTPRRTAPKKRPAPGAARSAHHGAGAWRSQVAHSLGVRVVGRSNRLAPTLRWHSAAAALAPPLPLLAGPAPWWHPAASCMDPAPLILV